MQIVHIARGPIDHLLYYLQQKSVPTFEQRITTPTRLLGLVSGKADQIREDRPFVSPHVFVNVFLKTKVTISNRLQAALERKTNKQERNV